MLRRMSCKIPKRSGDEAGFVPSLAVEELVHVEMGRKRVEVDRCPQPEELNFSPAIFFNHAYYAGAVLNWGQSVSGFVGVGV